MAAAHIERQEVYNMYEGKGWKSRVKKMSDAQVHAIYMKEQAKKAVDKQKPKPDDIIPF